MARILLINAFVIGENTGTGQTFKNIFADYPKDKILQFCVEERNIKNYLSPITTIYSKREYYPIDNFIRNNKVISFFRNRTYADAGSFPVFHADTKVTIKSALHDFLRGILDMSKISLPTSLIRSIDDFAPEVIYTCGASIRILKITNFFAERYNINIILHLMDDWPETIYTTSFLSSFAHKIILKEMKKVNGRSLQNFAISPMLAKKYSNIFNKPYIPLMNPAVEITEKPIENNSQVIRFTYTGSLSLNRWQSLLEIANVLQKLRNSGVNNEFHLYVPSNLNTEENSKLFSKKGATLFDYVPSNEVSKVLAKSDVLVFTESFEERIVSFTELSLSTKIPEYMGAGKPILAFLPSSLFSSEYIQEKEVGLVTNNIQELEEIAIRLITDLHLRRTLAENSIRCALNEHSLDIAWQKLKYAVEVSTKQEIGQEQYG